MRKKGENHKKEDRSAAWKLFYEQGYDNTTVDDIVEESGTSKGSFYHYFEGKDALLSSLSFLFDEKYEELMPSVDPEMNSVEKLLYLNRELFGVIENTVSLELLARLFSSQLITKGERHLLDSSRIYYKVLRQIISEGQQRGQIRDDVTANEISKLYAMWSADSCTTGASAAEITPSRATRPRSCRCCWPRSEKIIFE